MGSIAKHGRRWRLTISHGRGNRTRYLFDTYEEAARAEKIAEARKQMERATHRLIPQRVTFRDLAAEYLELRRHELRPSSLRIHRIRLRALTPHLGHLLIDQIDERALSIYTRARLAEGRARSTVNAELAVLRTVLNRAEEWGYDVPRLKTRRLREEKSIPPWLSKADCLTIIEAAPDETVRAYLRTATLTGLRRSELDHLTWNDIDWTGHGLYVRPKPGWQPKTGPRVVPLPDEVADALASLPRPCAWVFTLNGKDRPPERTLDERLDAIRAATGIRFNIRMLRHSFASHRAEEGWPLSLIAAWLGHTKISTTQIYSHLSPDHLRESRKSVSLGQHWGNKGLKNAQIGTSSAEKT